MINEAKNTGLMSTFNIKEGKFELVGGVVKCQDNMRMLLAFANWFRYYYQDFCVNIYWMLQKPTAFIQNFKTVALGSFMATADRYCPFLKIQKANIFYTNMQRKELSIGIEYTYSLGDRDEKNTYAEILNP